MSQPYTFTPTPLLTPNLESIEPRRYGTGIVGRGNKGEGTGAGSNIFKANAIEEIVKRGPGGGSDPNKFDDGDLGLVARMTGVTVDDLNNRQNSLNKTLLENEYNKKFEALGSDRRVQFGDSAESLNVTLNKIAESQQLDKTEPDRVRRETTAEKNRVNERNLEISQLNQQGALQIQQLNQQAKNAELDRERQRNRDKESDRRYYADRADARESRAADKELLMAQLQAQKYEIDERNNLRRDEFEYKKQLDQRQRSQDIANGFMSLVAAFAL